MSDTIKMIALAAKALGLELVIDNNSQGYYSDWRGLPQWNEWNPVDDQADSDRMGCDLEISTLWNPIHEAYCYAGAIGFAVPHDGTIEGRRAAVRLARAQVAAEMGRAK